MTFAEVQVLAENVGAAGRSLTTPGRSQLRWSMPSPQVGRPKTVVAASAESSSYPGDGTPFNSFLSEEQGVVAAAEVATQGGGYVDHLGAESVASASSSI
jgi:hypothetical protein